MPVLKKALTNDQIGYLDDLRDIEIIPVMMELSNHIMKFFRRDIGMSYNNERLAIIKIAIQMRILFKEINFLCNEENISPPTSVTIVQLKILTNELGLFNTTHCLHLHEISDNNGRSFSKTMFLDFLTQFSQESLRKMEIQQQNNSIVVNRLLIIHQQFNNLLMELNIVLKRLPKNTSDSKGFLLDTGTVLIVYPDH